MQNSNQTIWNWVIMQRENTKLKILLIGRAIVVVSVHSLSKLTPANLLLIAKQYLMSIFIIFREHKFLRNIFSCEELTTTDSLKDPKTYHQTFVKFLKIVIVLKNALNTHEKFSDCFNENLLNFSHYNCVGCSDFNELKETIGSVKVKNNLGFKISKFTLQIYAVFDQKLMEFCPG